MKVTFQGNPLTLVGTQVKVGDKLKDFSLAANDLSAKTLADVKGEKFTVISVVPSLDTGVCDTQTKKFADAIDAMDGVSLITVSCDLPFAQARWCGANKDTVTLSDYATNSFSKDYGLLIDELKLSTRAVIIADANNEVVYADIMNEVTDHPNYDAVLEIIKG